MSSPVVCAVLCVVPLLLPAAAAKGIGTHVAWLSHRAGFVRPQSPAAASSNGRRLSRAAAWRLQASIADLHTAYESLAVDRYGEDEASKFWMGTGNSDEEPWDGAGADVPSTRVPLYPLPACYLPSGATQRLNNVEPRNIRMAEDLKSGKWDGLFCVAMRTLDTGRVSRIGTMMRLISAEEQLGYDGSVLRVAVECRAEQLVHIDSIENSSDLKEGSDEYRIANVRPFELDEGSNASGLPMQLARDLSDDYCAVRSMYIEEDGVGAKELPPFAADAIRRDIMDLTSDSFSSPSCFWDAAEMWQMLCATVREAHRSDLYSNLNEVMIDAAAKKGGPLRLPVKREHLSVEVQMKLRRMELEAMENYEATHMDPCLQFQALLSCRGWTQSMKLLSRMILRERRRLEAKKSLKGVLQKGPATDELCPQRGGFE